jgi:hypothetical protein
MPTPSSTVKARRAKIVNTEPLVVQPKQAWIMLSCGATRGFALLAAGELDSFLDGQSRKITVESIRRYVSRRAGAGYVPRPPRRRPPVALNQGDGAKAA